MLFLNIIELISSLLEQLTAPVRLLQLAIFECQWQDKVNIVIGC